MKGDYDDWTVRELKEALKERGLPVSDIFEKHVLIERLESSEGLEDSSRGENYHEGVNFDQGDISDIFGQLFGGGGAGGDVLAVRRDGGGDGEGRVIGSSYDDWTVKELKEALKERGLPVSGKKRVLIERLHLLRPEKKEKSSRRKNYLEEGVLDAGDAELVEQIKAKYRAPDYRPPESKDGEYTKISNAVIALGLSAVAALYFLIIEGHAIGILAVVTAGWLVSYIRQEIKKTDIVSTGEVNGVVYVLATGSLMIFAFLWIIYTEGLGKWAGFYFCSLIILMVIPNILFGDKHATHDSNQKLKRRIASREKFPQEHERAWEDAQKHEEHNQFDAAMRIWTELGEEGEVERVTRLKTECLCVLLKRKIKDLTEMGADCTQLEEQLAMIETALAESATSKSSIGTESEE